VPRVVPTLGQSLHGQLRVASLVEGSSVARRRFAFILFGLNEHSGSLQLSKLVKIFEIYDTKSNPWRLESAKPQTRKPDETLWN